MKSSRPDGFFKCKETLELLDYLRKSQCMSGADGDFGKVRTTPKDGKQRGKVRFSGPPSDGECLKTLNMMEDVAKECLESSGFKFK